jgi:copper chaperone CopZ
MDFNATIDLIIKDLNEASEIIDDLKKYPGVPALQVELAKSKCRSAGDVIALLKSLGDIIPVRNEKVQEKEKEPETKKSEIKSTETFILAYLKL